MKKTNLLFAALFCVAITKAQIQPMGGGAQPMGAPLTQTWTTTPMTVSSGIEAKLGTQNSYPLKFYTNGSDRMEISTDGQVKILGLADTVSKPRFLYINSAGNISARCPSCPGLPIQCGAGSDPWLLGGNSVSSASNANVIGTCNNLDFILQAHGNKNIFIKTDGRVNLGIDNDISNNASTNAALDISAPLTNNPNSNQRHHLRLYGDETGIVESTSGMNLYFSDTDVFTINSGTPNNSTSIFEIVGTGIGGGSGGNAYLYTNANVSGNFSVSNKFSVANSTGKTIIGDKTITSGSHTDALLTVNGKIAAKEVVATPNNWSDFVFYKNYKLPTLKHIEDFYTKYGHLENIPSEKEVIENGIDLGEMNKLLLQKIEESTIYIVNLNKQMEAMNKSISDLQEKVKQLEKRK